MELKFSSEIYKNSCYIFSLWRLFFLSILITVLGQLVSEAGTGISNEELISLLCNTVNIIV